MFLEKFYATINRLAEFLLNLSPSGLSFSDSVFSLIVVGIVCSGIVFCLINIIHAKKARLRSIQQEEIQHLAHQLAEKTDELQIMQRVLTPDFHNQTGNLVSGIMQEAKLLRMKADDDLKPFVENILENSTQLSSILERSEFEVLKTRDGILRRRTS